MKMIIKESWSEDDEKCLENAIMYCEWARDKAPDLYCYETSEKSINWLKNLKDRVQPQLKQEWSEEDEKMLKDTIRFCELCGNQVSANWLKSLRPQSQWKPSEEQMSVIEAVINNRSFQKRHLDSLYEQLKKLK